MAPVISSARPCRMVPLRESLACFTFSTADKCGSLMILFSIHVLQIPAGRFQFTEIIFCVAGCTGVFDQVQDGFFHVLAHFLCTAHIKCCTIVEPFKKFMGALPDLVLN